MFNFLFKNTNFERSSVTPEPQIYLKKLKNVKKKVKYLMKK